MAAVADLAWAEASAFLEERQQLTPTRAKIVDRYARAYAEYETHFAEAALNGPVNIGERNGGEFASLKWSAIEKLNERLMKFERSLGISVEGKSEPVATGGAGKPQAKALKYLNH